jgi:hypothetical protein
LQGETVARIPIRRISIVVNLNDPLAPELTISDYKEMFGADPDPAKYRIINLEVLTSPDDQQPMLVSECGRYSRFIKREGGEVYFRRQLEP